MTRAEIKLMNTEKSGYRVASFFSNSSAYPRLVVPILMNAIKEVYSGVNGWGEFYKAMGENFDCDPVANISYIYEVYMDTNTIKIFDVKCRIQKYKEGKFNLWYKGKCIGVHTGSFNEISKVV